MGAFLFAKKVELRLFVVLLHEFCHKPNKIQGGKDNEETVHNDYGKERLGESHNG